jgi:hypothetical protein
MLKVKTFIASAALTALAATAIAVPAAAAPGKGTIGLVNGAPGSTRVDLCINGKEIRGNTKYGGRAYRILSPGSKTIKVYKADPRKCKGKLLGKKFVPLVAGDDWTIVFTRKSPKFTMFANTIADVPAAPGDPLPYAIVYLRHAADFGDLAFSYRYQVPGTPLAPSADPVWQKGDSYGTSLPQTYGWQTYATRPDKDWKIAQTPMTLVENSTRVEHILLGDNVKNAKFIVWIRDIVEK